MMVNKKTQTPKITENTEGVTATADIAENTGNTEGLTDLKSREWLYVGPVSEKIYREGCFFTPRNFDEAAIEALFKTYDWAHEWFVKT